MATLIWQEEHDGTEFRIQTDEFDIHQKISGRKEFKLVGEGMNIRLWVYRAKFPSFEKAQQMLRSLTDNR